MENLRALETFIVVAETLSFAEAGRRSGLSPSAVGKTIAKLEAALGVRLFHRTTRRVSLTFEGEVLLERGRRLQDAWRDIEAVLGEAAAEPRGWLRLSLPAIGYRFLAPHLEKFATVYPNIRLDLDLDDRIRDIVGEGFDAAIRSGILPDSSLVARKLGGFRFVFCAAPLYLGRRGRPDTIDALAERAHLRFRRPQTTTLQDWTLASGPSDVIARATPSAVFTNMEAVRAAAIAGLGIAWVPEFLILDAIASGQLETILDRESTQGTFWLVSPARALTSPKLRVFADFAAARFFRPFDSGVSEGIFAGTCRKAT